MDDGLVLNLAFDDEALKSTAAHSKKGGRWTDRLKAKRVQKRKIRPTEINLESRPFEKPTERPAKRPRTDAEPRSRPQPSTQSKPRTNVPIISSLFSYNPKIEPQASSSTHPTPGKPSNAPLTDSSTFAGLGLDPLITAHLTSKMNILKPTSVQRAALPALLTPANPSSSRDAFIQSQTGSGKTLSYLLPIIQDLLPLSSNSYIDRSIGTLAIIIAPTRELAKQISDVLELLLQLRLRPQEETPEGAEGEDGGGSSARLTRWLVAGLLTGGATRTHEKARLRKGVPILVSTPGRLLDHLQNTSAFNVGKCRWLVLDEADRLMELGFEDTVKGILAGLEGRRKLAVQAVKEGRSVEVGGWDWEVRRRTVLCSATMREDVQVLAGTTLQDPIMIKATEIDLPNQPATNPEDGTVFVPPASEKFTPPSQLSQKFVVVPLKLRLVTLVALLRSLLAQSPARRSSKIIVFLSCTDSVDFHWRLLAGSSMDADDEAEVSDSDEADSDAGGEDKPAASKPEKVEVKSELLPEASISRLHGSLPLSTRLASLRAFSAVPKSTSAPTASILLCTSVASRGLDLPLVRAVVQYDLPTEGGATEYVHRVGRTARAGKGGEAWSILAPSEAEWVKWVEGKMHGPEAAKESEKAIRLQGVDVNEVLKKGFGGQGGEYEARATDVQLAFERWGLKGKENAELARKAFLSHMRAYATHPSDEKHIFHIRHLHIGHLAKAFALREAPSSMRSMSSGGKTKVPFKSKDSTKAKPTIPKPKQHRAGMKERDEEKDVDAEKRMREAVRSQGKFVRKGGAMVSTGASEFQVASGYALEKLVNRA